MALWCSRCPQQCRKQTYALVYGEFTLSLIFTFTFMHLADFYPKRLTIAFRLYICQYMCSLGIDLPLSHTGTHYVFSYDM